MVPSLYHLSDFKILNMPWISIALAYKTKTLMSIFLLVSLVHMAVLPSMDLLILVIISMGLDFILGLIKAYFSGTARTSLGFRKSITKFIQYLGAAGIGIILANTAKDHGFEQASNMMEFFTNGLLIFIIYIELVSCCENIYAVDRTSLFAKMIIKPLYSILTFQIKNNPALKALEKLGEKSDEEKQIPNDTK